jgi:rubrerythrin
MAHSASRSGQSPIEDVIDGINDADIPAVEKQRLLRRIEKEGGVYSQELREDLIRVFDEQAAQERQNIRDNDALLKKLDQERAAVTSIDDLGDATRVAAEVMAEQGRVAKQIDDDVLAMRSDVMGMERQASQVEESRRGAIEQEEIEKLRKNLKGS